MSRQFMIFLMFAAGASASMGPILMALYGTFSFKEDELTVKQRLDLTRQKLVYMVVAGLWVMVFAIGVKVLWD